jgi:hypothetical protein
MKATGSTIVCFKIVLFLTALSLTIWRGYGCIERYLEFRRTTVVKMSPKEETLMPALTVCPAYELAYREGQLLNWGIPGIKDYRKGNFRGSSSIDERDIYENVTYSFYQLVEEIKIGYPADENNKSKKTLKPEEIVVRLVKYPTLGKCFEIKLEQFGETLEYVRFNIKERGYIYVNIGGQFINRDSQSKVEVNTKECLWIELTYEVMIQNEETNCRKYRRETYDECSERESEAHLVKLYNCTVPLINSPNNTPICRDVEKAKEVSAIG